MAIELIDTIKPKNGGSFPIVEAADVEMPDGTRLSDFNPSTEIPTFDLASMGLAAVTFPTGSSVAEIDTADIVSALNEGDVRFVIPVSLSGTVIPGYFTMQSFADGNGTHQCVSIVYFNMMLILMVIVENGKVTVMIQPMSGLPSVSGTDNGKIMEVVNGTWAVVSVADSSVKTYVDDYISSALEGEY